MKHDPVPNWVDTPAVVYKLVAFSDGGDPLQEIEVATEREFDELKRTLARMRGYRQAAQGSAHEEGA